MGKTSGKKADLLKRYIDTPRPPPRTNIFSAQDGERLQYLMKGDVAMKETALGVAAKQNVCAVINHLDDLDDTEKQDLLAALTKDTKRGHPKDNSTYDEGGRGTL